YGFDSPYNTYQVNGLPPGPIGQPSRASILAALYPAETDFLYFVATRNGHHEFSRSYREHLVTIRTLRRR
ncbi:MAG: endolytic transglycosylase MltG, partial [Gemmatimonadota bacterium]|nr:endolytic transglycosylase MltG [Gemmatimonadota bacterium]